MSIKVAFYGLCECGGSLIPAWFTEEGYKVTQDGHQYRTGRKRRAVSHLVCEACLKNFCVDDSFDGAWYE